MSRTCRGRICGESRAYVGMVVGISLLLGGCRIERHSPVEKAGANVSASSGGAASATNASSQAHAESPHLVDARQESSSLIGAAGSAATSTPSAVSADIDGGSASESQSAKSERQKNDTSPEDEASGVEDEQTAEDESVPPELQTIPEGWELFVFAGGSPLSSEIREFARKSIEHGEPTTIAAKIVARLETLPGTNAGPGSAFRLDGETIEASAVVLDGRGRSAIVGGLRQTLEPVMLAESLYRAGGGAIWGSAADELAARFELRRGSLEISRARANYLVDLSSAVQAGLAQHVGTLFSLYVKPEALTESLSVRSTRLAQGRVNRLPVFALVVAPDSRSALAVSHGGDPLALPGSRSAIEQAGHAVALKDSNAVIVFAQAQLCEKSASEILERLQMTRSHALAVQPLQSACEDARYLVFSRGGNKTNLDSESMLQMSGRPAEVLLKPALASVPALASARRLSSAPARASGLATVPAPSPTPSTTVNANKPGSPLRASEVTP